MPDRPALFDRPTLLRHRARAERPALFLHDAVADEIDERLKEVNRTFTDKGVVAGYTDPWDRFGTVFTDADHLDLGEAKFDLIIHGLSLHWAEDPVGQLIQCRRALRPDGLFLAAMFGGSTLSELRSCLAQAETEVSNGLSPRVAPMGEIRDLGGLLQRAGFALPVADSIVLNVTYQDAFALMRDLRMMGETNALASRARGFSRRAVFDRAAELYQNQFATADGRIAASFEVIFLTGWAPGSDQPQPLRPGSAKARLADALGVPEFNPEA